MPDPFSFSVAGIGVEVRGLPAPLHKHFSTRYHLFPPHNSLQYPVQVEILPDTEPYQDYKPALFHGKDILFETPWFAGHIQEQRGNIRVRHAHAYEDIDYFLRVVLAVLASRAGGLMLHAAGIIHRGRAQVLIGQSGAGKTTACRHAPPGTVMNDDLLVLLPTDDNWQVFGTPFWNPTQVVPTNQHAPLGRFLRLVQAKEVKLEPISPAQALAELLACVPVLATAPHFAAGIVQRVQKLAHAVPCHALHFLPNDTYWDVL